MGLGDPMPPSAHAGPLSSAIVRVVRLHRLMATQLLREVGLHPGQELVMMQLWDQGPQRQTDLVQVLESDAPTMTRTVQRLERAGFVRRRPSEVDRRATIVEATPASLAVRQQVTRIWSELERATTAELTDEQHDQAVGLLGQIEMNLSRVVELPSKR